MVITGSPAAFSRELFPDGFVPQVLTFVVDCWPLLTKPHPHEEEELITGRFWTLMKFEYPKRELPWAIFLEQPELDETGRMVNRTDLRFLHRSTRGQDTVLVLESKRLNVTFPGGRFEPNARAYTGEDGMLRFITGKYSKSLPSAGMMGYVMDGDVPSARKKVEKAMTTLSRELALAHAPSLQVCVSLSSPHGETRHNRDAKLGGPMNIFHLFLSV